jgi:hypothetical protein
MVVPHSTACPVITQALYGYLRYMYRNIGFASAGSVRSLVHICFVLLPCLLASLVALAAHLSQISMHQSESLQDEKHAKLQSRGLPRCHYNYVFILSFDYLY